MVATFWNLYTILTSKYFTILILTVQRDVEFLRGNYDYIIEIIGEIGIVRFM